MQLLRPENHRRILAIDAEHPDEWTAGIMHDSLKEHPIPNVDVIIGNTDAYYLNKQQPHKPPLRYCDKNLSHAYPGNPNGNREERRAHQIGQLAMDYDIVISFHGCEDAASWGGYSSAAPDIIKQIPRIMGIQNVVISEAGEPWNTASFIPQAFCVDTPRYRQYDLPSPWAIINQHYAYINSMRSLLKGLTNTPLEPTVGWQYHKEFYNAGAISLDQMHEAGLKNYYHSFQPLPQESTRKLGFSQQLYAATWNAARYTHTGYAGEVVSLERYKPRIPEPSLTTAYANTYI